jgi:hypothetical protein
MVQVRARLAAAVAAVVAGAILMPAGAAASPATPDDPDVIVAGPDGDQKAWFPDITRLDDGRLVTVFYQATRHSRDDGRYMWTESTDGGRTWSRPRVVIDTPQDDRDAQITQLSDGTIVINWFRTDWTNEGTTGAVILGAFVTRSTDGGRSWSDPVLVESRMSCGCGPVHGAYPLGWAATTGKIVELDDGDLLLPLYGTMSDSTVGRASVARSTDGGRTWPVENEALIPVPGGVSLSEMALAATRGGVTALLRTAGGGGVSRRTDSSDGGRTWSTPVATPMKGQAHHILSLPGGKLLATYGDRSGQFASNEPTVGRIRMPGREWSDSSDVLLYRAGPNVDQADPSTAVVRGHHFITVSYDEARGSIIGTFSKLSDFVQAKPPEVTEPDAGDVLGLPAMVAAGAATFETDLTSGHKNHPTARPAGAVDGVAEYWYSALGPVATPEAPRQFTLSFTEAQRVSWIGLNLKPGYAETASVYLSADGREWGDPVDVRTGHISAAGQIAWAELDRAATAEHVKVVISQSDGASMLAELMIAH